MAGYSRLRVFCIKAVEYYLFFPLVLAVYPTAAMLRSCRPWLETLSAADAAYFWQGVLLKGALDRVYPLVQPLGVSYPLLKLRPLKTQWGNCHWTQGYITLNTALARCPEELRDYVALHELVHFLHHDHGPGFYACMDALMPDWQRRRTELKGYGGALEHHGEGSEQT